MRDLLLNDVTRGLCDVTDKIVLVHLVTAVPGTSVYAILASFLTVEMTLNMLDHPLDAVK